MGRLAAQVKVASLSPNRCFLYFNQVRADEWNPCGKGIPSGIAESVLIFNTLEVCIVNNLVSEAYSLGLGAIEAGVSMVIGHPGVPAPAVMNPILY